MGAVKDIIEAKLSQLDEEHQQQVLAYYPRIIKALLKRLGNKVNLPAKELDGLGVYELTMGMDPQTNSVRLEIKRRPH